MKITLKPDRETILKLLRDSEMSKKIKIFNKLNDLNEADRTKILFKVMENGSWFLREKSAHELAKSGTKVAPRLVKMCRKGYWFSRAAACISLGEIGDPSTLEPIVHLLLDDENPTVMKEAQYAIIKITRTDLEGAANQIKAVVKEEAQVERILKIIECGAPELYEKFKAIVASRMPADGVIDKKYQKRYKKEG